MTAAARPANYRLRFVAVGEVVIRARSADEAKELANQDYGLRELAEVDQTVEDLEFTTVWDSLLAATEMPTTAVPADLQNPCDCGARAPHNHIS